MDKGEIPAGITAQLHAMLNDWSDLSGTHTREEASYLWRNQAERLLRQMEDADVRDDVRAHVLSMLDLYEQELGVTRNSAMHAPTAYGSAHQGYRGKGAKLESSSAGSQDGISDVPFTHPPACAEKLLYLFLPNRMRKPLIGDLEEEFRTEIAPKFGARFARVWYWKQVLSSLWPLLCRRLIKLASLAWLGKAASWLFSKLGT